MKIFLPVLALALLVACAVFEYVPTGFSSWPPLAADQKVHVRLLPGNQPAGAVEVGLIKVGDDGSGINGIVDSVREHARKVGANYALLRSMYNTADGTDNTDIYTFILCRVERDLTNRTPASR